VLLHGQDLAEKLLLEVVVVLVGTALPEAKDQLREVAVSIMVDGALEDAVGPLERHVVE
jgi:hypothetical protein